MEHRLAQDTSPAAAAAAAAVFNLQMSPSCSYPCRKTATFFCRSEVTCEILKYPPLCYVVLSCLEKLIIVSLKDWKTRLSYFLQNSSTPGKPKAGKKSKQAFAKPSPEEARLWAEAFDELLASKYGLAAFRAFLKSEFCEENIEFWLACEDFKKTKSPQKLSSKARKIYTDFIEKEAPKEINIDFQTKTLIAQNIQEATSGCFTTAQKRVYSLMENNSYPRFLESEFYQDLCKKPQITTEPHAT
ncbi:regulator of G-protein signaling 2 isoform X1 [Peromyscus californicus insignis]|uniref:regulator of G-protein signaling 2 isoform X1 n=1 Tax=Peromyscus californicus insignis TaxID=564181 RepID=UPI0022A6FE58|nr:regulator of G-protein signaling 2 isoform X1 [Peromyscus californicus insignis]